MDGNITVSGGSFNNQSGLAQNTNIIGVGTSNTLTVSGGGMFIGTVDAPGYDFIISGTANYSGAFIGNTINISGDASVHYDQALAGGNAGTSGYFYASWFEDTSDVIPGNPPKIRHPLPVCRGKPRRAASLTDHGLGWESLF